MLPPTTTFAAFFAVVFVGSWLLRSRRGLWKLFLLVASYVFYGWWNPWWCLVLLGLTVVDQVLAHGAAMAAPGFRRRWAVVAAVVHVAALVAVRQVGLFRDVVARVDGDTTRVVQVLVPVAFGLLVLQGLGYVLDVVAGRARPLPLVDAALVLAFFPKLLAGPLVPAQGFARELRRPADGHVDATRALRLVLTGLTKWLVLGSYLATRVVDPVFAAPERHGGLEIVLAAYATLALLYVELSGACDLAIGTSLLLGVRLPEAFHRPLVATGLRSFWARFHRTVTGWFRDHVFLPFGGGAGGTAAAVGFVVMFLAYGLWLGPKPAYLVWGLLNGVFLALEALLARHRSSLLPGVLGWLLTFNVASLGFVLIRAGSLGTAGALLGRLGDPAAASSVVTPLAVAIVALVVLLQAIPEQLVDDIDAAASRAPLLAQAGTLAVALVLIVWLGPDEAAPIWFLRF